MSTNLPIRAARPHYRQCLARRSVNRHFSSTPAQLRNKGVADPAFARMHMRNQESKAPSTMQAEAMQSGQSLNDDVGVLPGTFIRLPWSQLPSLLSTPKERLRYEWKWITTKFTDPWLRLWYWARLTPWKTRPRPNIWKKGVVQKAKDLHEELYGAIARGDKKQISDICLSSLSSHLSRQLSQLPQNAVLSWSRTKVLGEYNPLHFLGLAGPRIVSDRATQISLSGWEQTGFRQVVVRLPSTQVLTAMRKSSPGQQRQASLAERRVRQLAWSPDGEQPQPLEAAIQELGDTTREQSTVEYLVLQKRTVRGVEEEWKVWGFAEPTTVERIERDKQYRRELEDYESARGKLT